MQPSQFQNASRSKLLVTAGFLLLALVLGFVFFGWAYFGGQETQLTPALKDSELHALGQIFLLPEPKLPNASERALAHFGEKLFHDKRFSKSHNVSCASCHRPSLDFQDGLSLAQGELTGSKNTPSIVNMRYQSWFFWDGRSSNLIHQALGPMLSHLEHFSNYSQIARVVRRYYKKEYQKLFGPWPPDINEELLQVDFTPSEDFSKRPKDVVYAYFLKHLPTAQQKLVFKQASKKGVQPVALLKDWLGAPNIAEPYQALLADWKNPPEARLGKKHKASLAKVAENVARAIAHFEMQVVTDESPFDVFAKRFGDSTPAEDAFGPGFGADEYAGFKLFVGKAQCMLCHVGPMFMDQSFHNIGVDLDAQGFAPQQEEKEPSWSFDLLGRTAAFFQSPPRVDPKKSMLPHCIQEKLPESAPDACDTLAALDPNNLSMVGAYKTPSLRNVAKHSPHFHNGSAQSLADVVSHYNKPPKSNGIGKTEETVKALGLSAAEQAQLVAFMRSLSSETRMLHHE